MKQVLIEIDEETATELERVAPARSRRRSQFIRAAIRKALWDLQETQTAEAYRREPDSAADVPFDASVWDPGPPQRRHRKRR